MRKIEKLMLQAIEALTTKKTDKGWSKDNTIVVNAGDRAKVFLHGNHIADVFYKGGLEDWSCELSQFERFAALVAAAEREACAKVCEEEAFYHFTMMDFVSYDKAMKLCGESKQ